MCSITSFKINDYIEGFEYFGSGIRKISGQIKDITNDDKGNLIIFIICDERKYAVTEACIHTKLGEVNIITDVKTKKKQYFLFKRGE